MRVLTAGESHGPAVIAIVDGVPAGIPVTAKHIDRDLERRQGGYGRGGRMKIEHDSVRILSGVRDGLTMGSPVTLVIENRDFESWADVMSAEPAQAAAEPETRPRPGHGDLAGMLKYGTLDARNILERASARETAARVAAGAVAKRLLNEIGIVVRSRVVQIGGIRAPDTDDISAEDLDRAEADAMRCADPETSAAMVAEVDRAIERGYSLGGVFEVFALGVMPGLGSHAQADRRLDARLCAALISVPAIKGVEVGEGFSLASTIGSDAHDEIFYAEGKSLYRRTNRAGGLEAGMTNGEPIVLRSAMKPIPTLAKPLATVDMKNLEAAEAFKERADVCAVPAASVVGEAVVAIVLADAVQEKLGGDSLEEIKRNLDGYLQMIARFWRPR